jgi:hypothetical protein
MLVNDKKVGWVYKENVTESGYTLRFDPTVTLSAGDVLSYKLW